MFYYQITFNEPRSAFKKIDIQFIEEHQCFYIDNEDTVYFISSQELSRNELSIKINDILDSSYIDFDVQNLEKDTVLKSLKSEDIEQLSYLLLHSKEKTGKEKSCFSYHPPKLAVQNIIGLSEFKEFLEEFIHFLHIQDQRKQRQEQPLDERRCIILQGRPGTGKKYAMHYLKEILGTEISYFLGAFSESDCKSAQQIIALEAFNEAFCRMKQSFSKYVTNNKDSKLYVFLADSESSVKELTDQFKHLFYTIRVIKFPDYSEQELKDILNYKLSKFAFQIEENLLDLLIANEEQFETSYDSCRLAKRILEQGGVNKNQLAEIKAGKVRKKNSHQEMEHLIGLHNVKHLISKILAYALVNKVRSSRVKGLVQQPMHFVFSGPAGTGKTHVARLFARILFEHGIIKREKVVEVGRTDLVAEYVGQTAPKVRKVFNEARGGVLFIDEAYSLIPQSERDFATEAIPAMVQEMENLREEVIVIFAGYEKEMELFLRTNQGLSSRITNEIHFDSYSNEELYAIIKLMAEKKGHGLQETCKEELINHFKTASSKEEFGNARYARKLLEIALYAQAQRLMAGGDIGELTDEELNLLTVADVQSAIEDLKAVEPASPAIGFRRAI